MSSQATIKTSIDANDLRQCLGRFATGVTVITCTDDEGRRRGVTANSFTSVSLDPPLVLWSIATQCSSCESYVKAGRFVINILAAEQKGLSRYFAQSGLTLCDDVPHELRPHGSIILSDALAWIECRAYRVSECGDHHMILGEVVDYNFTDSVPLLFYSGRYTSLPVKP